MEKFYLSNSKMRDWEDMCPLEWKAKYIDKAFPDKPSEAMMWGNYFEILVFGATIHGSTITLTEKMQNSVNKGRVEEQARKCRHWLKLMGGKKIAVQLKLQAEIRNADGELIPIEGTIDGYYGWEGQERFAIYDAKNTGDTESTFGKFAWGKPDTMDYSQILNYGLLHREVYKKDAELYYFIFDNSAAMKEKAIQVMASDWSYEKHLARMSKAYNEISECMLLNHWPADNQYKNCKDCQLKTLQKCPHERQMVEIIQVFQD